MTFKPNIVRVFAYSFFSVALVACTTTAGYFSPYSSVDSANLDSLAADAVASDIVAKLAEIIGPGTGTIILSSDGTAFSSAFERRLRAWGYAVDTAATGQNAIPLAFTINRVDGEIFVRISTKTVELTRSYRASAGGYEPSSPLSVLKTDRSGNGVKQ